MTERLSERDRLSGRPAHLEKWFFGLCAVVGAIAIVLVDAANASKWTAVSICVVVMTTYALSAFHAPGLKLRPDQAADNLYYLGLLDTLVSLGVALIRFTSSEQATDAILRNFGIAIFTTIVGLALRVLVGQFREDPEDLEEEARTALTDTIRRMRQELDLSVAELRSFADGMRQVVGEFTQRANTSTIEALERAVRQFEASAATMGQRIEGSAGQFSTRVQTFDTSLERVVTSLEGLMDRIGAVRADADVIERGMRPALDAVERAVSGFADAVGREQQRFQAGAEAVGRFSTAANSLGDAGDVVATAAHELRSAGADLGAVGKLVGELDSAARAAATASRDFSERLEGLAERADARNAESVRAVHEAASRAAADAAAEAERRLQALEIAARQVADALGSLDREFSGSSETVIRVRRELAEMAGWIVQRLDA